MAGILCDVPCFFIGCMGLFAIMWHEEQTNGCRPFIIDVVVIGNMLSRVAMQVRRVGEPHIKELLESFERNEPMRLDLVVHPDRGVLHEECIMCTGIAHWCFAIHNEGTGRIVSCLLLEGTRSFGVTDNQG